MIKTATGGSASITATPSKSSGGPRNAGSDSAIHAPLACIAQVMIRQLDLSVTHAL